MKEETRTSLPDTVTSQLLELGWKGEGGAALARKTYQTAVGPKDAVVYLTGLRSEGPSVLLQGDYRSEGRNILEPRGRLIDKLADEAAVRRVVTLFAEDADAAVAASYAGRLGASDKARDGAR